MRIPCKKLVLAFMVAVFFLTGTSLQAKSENIDKNTNNVALVNESGISRKNFDRAMASASKQFSSIGYDQSAAGANGPLDLNKEVLDRLIDFELMYQDAKKRGIVIEDSVLNENLEAFRKRFEKEEDFTAFLEQNNFTENEMKDQFVRELVMQELQQQLKGELLAKMNVSDADVKKFYDANIDKMQRPEQVKASHILVTVDEGADEATRQEARTKIDSLEKKIKAGEDFAETAKANSQCPSSENGGDLGFFGKGQMVKPFEDAAFALKPGEMSGVVETRFGYHLIKLAEKREAATASLEEVQENIKRYLTQLQMDKSQQEYVQSLRDNAKVTRLLDAEGKKEASEKK